MWGNDKRLPHIGWFPTVWGNVAERQRGLSPVRSCLRTKWVDWGIKLGSLVKGDSPRCGEMSRSDKGDGLPSGAGCEQREQTEGLKVTHVLFKFHITPRNPSGLPCGNPPPFSREAKSRLKSHAHSIWIAYSPYEIPPACLRGPPPFTREAKSELKSHARSI